MDKKEPKTLVGVLASHDSAQKNEALANIFQKAYNDKNLRGVLTKFRFVFTGGTYDRIIKGNPTHEFPPPQEIKHALDDDIARFLHDECGIIKLPSTNEGGVIMLCSLITLHQVSIVWPFFSPVTTHLLYPENLALLRLSDQWRVKKLMNSGSVEEWLQTEAERDANLNLQPIPLKMKFSEGEVEPEIPEATFRGNNVKHPEDLIPPEKKKPFPDLFSAKKNGKLDEALQQEVVLALISHDEMKSRMIDFVIDYEHELAKFKSILTTGTTGKLVEEAVPGLSEKIKKHHSGPKGGDVEIATQILLGGCHVVIFFVDPLHPHPHVEDIRLVFAACMIQDKVRMLSNEVQARDWMDRVIRGR